MSKTKRLRLNDLRSIYTLIGECCELGCDPKGWRRHLVESISTNLGARVVVTGDIPGYWTDQPVMMPPIHTDWGGRLELETWLEYMRQGGPEIDPIFQGISQLANVNSGRLITRSREQLIDNTTWYKSVYFNDFRRISRVDSTIISLIGLPPKSDFPIRPVHGDHRLTASIIAIHRTLGHPPFDDRERRWVRWLHHEIAPHIGDQLAACHQPSAEDLSPRVQQTLNWLLRGAAEKEIASELGISQATVHQYVTVLYRHFGVRSRSELLALWIRHRPHD